MKENAQIKGMGKVKWERKTNETRTIWTKKIKERTLEVSPRLLRIPHHVTHLNCCFCFLQSFAFSMQMGQVTETSA